MNKKLITVLLSLALILYVIPLMTSPALAASPTTSITVTKLANDGTTILDQLTVPVEFMMSGAPELPIYGDGVTHYYFQGPTFDPNNMWDSGIPPEPSPGETVNVDSRDYGAAMGTDVKDLCEMIGGASPGNVIKIKAIDGFYKLFDYEDVYTPEPEQGKMIITWYTANTAEHVSGYVTDGGYTTGMRLLFFADTLSPEGKHVFGLWDMHETLAESRWHYYSDGTTLWPSSSGLAVKWVSDIIIYSSEAPPGPEPEASWPLTLTGANTHVMDQAEFESGVQCHGAVEWVDGANTWSGLPLWLLVGYVDDDVQHGAGAFNDTLAAIGYEIKVIAHDGYNVSLSSFDVARNDNIIVANRLNGLELPDDYYPLRLVGPGLSGGQKVSIIKEIELLNLPNPPATTLSLQPSSITGPSPTIDIGKTFTLTLQVAEVSNLWSWKVAITWDPAVLELQGTPTEGAFLKGAGSTLFVVSPPGAGIIQEMSSTLLSATGVSGSGDLATMSFKILGYASNSPIVITTARMLDPSSPHQEIPFTSIGATFTLPPPGATSPQAAFSPADGQYYYVGQTVSLDASASIPGYDTVPSGTVCPITNYAWTLTGAFTGSFSGQTANFQANTAGDITISLTVTAPDPQPPSEASYNPTSAITHTIHVVTQPTGAAIDVYTDRGGQFLNIASDAYGPQELITIYANVTYNGAAVANKDVAFLVKDNNNAQQALRAARTDVNGVATTSFRLPWPSSNPEALFGTWTIIGTVDVSQVQVSDTCTFKFGYLITTQVTTTDTSNVAKNTFHRLETVRTAVVFSNIRSVPITLTLTVTIYDVASVPIATSYVQVTVPAGSTTTAAAIDLTIPSWSYVGLGTVYVNALTQLPQNNGVPYCPENSVQITIQK
jgi:hypothetical protein